MWYFRVLRVILLPRVLNPAFSHLSWSQGVAFAMVWTACASRNQMVKIRPSIFLRTLYIIQAFGEGKFEEIAALDTVAINHEVKYYPKSQKLFRP